MPRVISQFRLYRTRDRDRLVEEGDPGAAFLCTVPGRPLEFEDEKIYQEFVERKALDNQEQEKAAAEQTGKKESEPEETKVIFPPENKRTGRKR